MTNKAPQLNNEQLLQVLTLTKSACAIHIGEDAIIQFANGAMLKIWDKDESVIGKSLEDALPELKGQPFIHLFRKVWREGITISGKETPANLVVDGKLQTFYFDFEYRGVLNEAGETLCILHTATDVTDRVLSSEREQNLVEELKATNEELTAANEALYANNEILNDSQSALRSLYEALAESNKRFKSMVKQAPVGICIIRANDLFIQDVNDSYLELVGKHRSELENRTIWEAVPEAADAYAPILNNVIVTGIPFVAKEHEVILIRNKVPETVFLDFVYEPMTQDNTVTAIMVLVIDVTDKVKARRSVEEMEERVRLAVDAADVGTFDSDLLKDSILTSERFDKILGFEKAPSWKEIISMVHPDDLRKRETAYDEAYRNGKLNYEARVIFPDGSIHWIKVQGKVSYDNDRKPIRIVGTLLDITNFKRLEQQKDDFISIASHELKTPITSLKASLQLLERMKDNPSSTMLPRLIEQSGKSMRKISSLVDDLLNVSRSSASQLSLNKTFFTLTDIINSCRDHIQVSGNYTLSVEGDEGLELYADEHAIDQVIINLVNNAVKYASESYEIVLSIKKENNKAMISVTDKGPGIPEEKIAHLFDRYYQAQPSGFNNSGLGLGLYISADIIKRHGGEIGVVSNIGKGCTFWFTLPVI